MSTITTYTRKHFDPVHPDPNLLCVEDIAHALPMICRGNGHVTTFWSVGEHCICCAKEAAARGYSKRLVLACLLHDASECYMSDVPRPLKQEMPRYREIEDRLLSVIYEKYLGSDLTVEEQRMMKQIDNDLLWYDLTNLLEEQQEGEAPKLHIKLDYTVRSFEKVEKEYLELFYQISEKVRNFMRYQVMKIEEDIDFGCEERGENQPVMAIVVLKDENGEKSRIRQEDQMLYDRKIEEGDAVILNEKGELQKAISGDWTKHCNSQNVDTTKFVNMMQAVKAGKQVDWICPFCGGKVERLEQESGQTVIGCTTCDMRIRLN